MRKIDSLADDILECLSMISLLPVGLNGVFSLTMIRKDYALPNCTFTKDLVVLCIFCSELLFTLLRYLDPSQIEAAQTLATFSTKLGRLPPNRKVTDGISKFLAALRDVALDRMAAEWGQGKLGKPPV